MTPFGYIVIPSRLNSISLALLVFVSHDTVTKPIRAQKAFVLSSMIPFISVYEFQILFRMTVILPLVKIIEGRKKRQNTDLQIVTKINPWIVLMEEHILFEINIRCVIFKRHLDSI